MIGPAREEAIDKLDSLQRHRFEEATSEYFTDEDRERICSPGVSHLAGLLELEAGMRLAELCFLPFVQFERHLTKARSTLYTRFRDKRARILPVSAQNKTLEVYESDLASRAHLFAFVSSLYKRLSKNHKLNNTHALVLLSK